MAVITIKKSIRTGVFPTLVDGELAFNLADKRLFTKDMGGNVKYLDFTSDLEKVTSGPIKAALDTKAGLDSTNTFQRLSKFRVGLDIANVEHLSTDGSLKNRVNSGFWQHELASIAKGYPTDGGWHNIIASTHNDPNLNFSLQLAAPFFQNSNFFIRSTNNDGGTEWNKLWHDKNLRFGVSPGFIPKYDNLDGSGVPVLNTQSRLYHIRQNATAGRYADYVFTNNGSNLVGGVSGNTDAVLLALQTIDKKVDTYQWTMGSQVQIENAYTIDSSGNKIYSSDPNTGAAGGGQHCGLNTQVFVRANCTAFGFNSNVVDYVDQPTAGRIGYEAGMGITGLDPNKMRCVLAINIGSAAYDTNTQQGIDGDNRVHKGAVIGPTNSDSNKAQFTNALFFEGKNKITINMTGVETNWCDSQIVALPNKGDIVWNNPTEYLTTPIPLARFGYNSEVGLRYFINNNEALRINNDRSILAQRSIISNEKVGVKSGYDSVIELDSFAIERNKYAVKQIILSPNVGGGNDWLFRSLRPSDNSVIDYRLLASAGGDIWTTGNLNPQNLNFNNQINLKTVTDPGDGKSRIEISRAVPTNYMFADLHLFGDTRAITENNSSGVQSALRIERLVGQTNAWQWPLLCTMTLEGSSQSENCTGYFQITKKGNSGSWTICTELRDLVPSTTRSSIGWECGIFGRGADPNRQRVGIDMSCWSGQNFDAGDNEISYGMRIGPSHGTSNWTQGVGTPAGVATATGRIIVKTGIELSGNMGICLDVSNSNATFSTTAVKLNTGQRIVWDGGGFIGSNIWNLPDSDAPTSTSDPRGSINDVIKNGGHIYFKTTSGWFRVTGSTF